MPNSFVSPTRSRGSQSSGSSRSPLERKESLRAVLDKTRVLHNVDDTTVKNLQHIVREADSISLEATIEEKVSNHDEVLMDSAVMSASSRVLRSTATSLTKEMNPYNIKDFVQNLLQYVYTRPDETATTADWSIPENEFCQMFKKTPNYTNLNGCLTPLEPKEPAVVVKRQPTKRDALAPTKRPDAIVEVAKDDDSVEETVKKIKKLISHHHKDKGAPLEFFRLVLHPTDFGKTVENMLHVSFLVRDGLMQMKMDKNGAPVIMPSTSAMRAEKDNSDQASNIQNVIALSFQQWQFLVAELKIKKPMIVFN